MKEQPTITHECTIDITHSDIFKKHIKALAMYTRAQHRKAINQGKIRNATPIDTLTTDPEILSTEYRAIMAKTCKLPASLRAVIKLIGDKAYIRTRNEIIEQLNTLNETQNES